MCVSARWRVRTGRAQALGMQTPLLSGLGLLALLGTTAIAQPRHHETARREGGRSTGTITHGQAGARETGHRVY